MTSTYERDPYAWARRTFADIGISTNGAVSDGHFRTELAAEGYSLDVEIGWDDMPYELGDVETEYPAEVVFVGVRVFDPAGNVVGMDALFGIGTEDFQRDPYVALVVAECIHNACDEAHVTPNAS